MTNCFRCSQEGQRVVWVYVDRISPSQYRTFYSCYSCFDRSRSRVVYEDADSAAILEALRHKCPPDQCFLSFHVAQRFAQLKRMRTITHLLLHQILCRMLC